MSKCGMFLPTMVGALFLSSTTLTLGACHTSAELTSSHQQGEHNSSVPAILIIGGATPDEVEGIGDGDFIADAVAYVPSQDRWYDIADMPTSRRAMGYTVYEGDLYVYGGWTAGDPTDPLVGPGNLKPVDVLEVYDPATNTWRTGAPMPEPTGKMGHFYPEVDGVIYVGGGERQGSRLDQFVSYDIASDVWHTHDSMPATRTFPYVMANPNQPHLIHFVAGNTDEFHDMSDFHHVYNAETSQWDTTNYPPFPIDNTDGDAGSMYQGYWWFQGGWNRNGPTNITKAYDFQNDRWLAMPRPGSRPGTFASWTHQASTVIEVDGQERLYKIGGRIDRQNTDAVWYFDGQAWHEASFRLPFARWNFIAVTMELNVDNLDPL